MNGFFDWFDMTAPYQEDVKEYQATGNAPPSLINNFKAKARDWAINVVTLTNTEVPPSLQSQKRTLLSRANIIKTGVEKIFGTMDEFVNVGLGLLPVVPIAVLGASIAAMTKWTYDFVKFMTAVKEQRRLEATGMSPDKAAEIANQNLNKPFINIDMKNLILPAVLIGGAVWYFSHNRS